MFRASRTRRYIIKKKEWEAAIHPNERTSAVYIPERLQPLQEHGQLQFIEATTELFPGIKAVFTGGHSEGHYAHRDGIRAASEYSTTPTSSQSASSCAIAVCPGDRYLSADLDGRSKRERCRGLSIRMWSWRLTTHVHQPLVTDQSRAEKASSSCEPVEAELCPTADLITQRERACHSKKN